MKNLGRFFDITPAFDKGKSATYGKVVPNELKDKDNLARMIEDISNESDLMKEEDI